MKSLASQYRSVELCGKERNLGNVSEAPWAGGKSCEDKGATRITARPEVVSPLGKDSLCPSVRLPAPHTHVFLSPSRIGTQHGLGACARRRPQKLTAQSHGTRETPQTYLGAVA